MADKVQLRGGTAAQWVTANPILSEKEVGIETDTRKFKFGDGSTAWNSLPYVSSDSGPIEWGNIGGDIADQLDLIELLNDKQPIDVDLTDISALNPNDNDILQRKAGAWTNRTPAQLKSDLALSKGDVGLGNVDNTSDVDKPVSTLQASADAAVLASAQSYANGLVVGLWDDRGGFDASVNAYPSSGGSGAAGAILKGDIWTVTVAGTLPTAQVVEVGDVVRALIDTPGNTQGNWSIQQNNIGYTAENSANKSTDVATDQASNVKYPTVKAVYDWVISLGYQVALTAANFGAFIVGLTDKATPVDADTIPISDSAASNVTKKLTWANIKATLKAFFDNLLPYITPEMYGAVGDGVTNDATALTNAIAASASTGKTLRISKTHLVSSQVVIPSGASIRGNGFGAKIITTTNGSIDLFAVQGINIFIEGLTFQGNSTGSQVGISARGNAGLTSYRYDIKIKGCTFFNLSLAGIYTTNIVGNSSGTQHQGGVIVESCNFYSNGTGILFDARGEYSVVTNCKFYQNTTQNVRVNGGNNTFVNCQSSDSPIGLFIGTGTNDGHGSWVGGSINHNTTNVQSVSTANGFMISGAFMWAGNIVLTTTNGIKFHDCSFSTLTISSNTSTRCEFVDCHFQTDPIMSLTSTTLYTRGCVFETGNLVSPFNNTGSATLTFGLIAAQGTSTQTITVTGAAVNDIVTLGIPHASMVTGLQFTWWVSAANTVSVQCYNSTAGGITPTPAAFKAMIIKDR